MARRRSLDALYALTMAQRTFHLPDSPLSSPGDGDAVAADGAPTEAGQRPGTHLVGGLLEMRRQHGKAPALSGRRSIDPIFRPGDLDRLTRWCDPSDPRQLHIEIGFQYGKFASELCMADVGLRYLGFEVRHKWCNEAERRMDKAGVENALIALVDAREVLGRVLNEASVDAFYVFFPDPWWKKKHARKRLISPSFIADVARWLRPGGRLVVKTDVAEYADLAEVVLRGETRFEVTRLDDSSAGLPLTRREVGCARRELPTWAFEARRCIDPPDDEPSPPSP